MQPAIREDNQPGVPIPAAPRRLGLDPPLAAYHAEQGAAPPRRIENGPPVLPRRIEQGQPPAPPPAPRRIEDPPARRIEEGPPPARRIEEGPGPARRQNQDDNHRHIALEKFTIDEILERLAGEERVSELILEEADMEECNNALIIQQLTLKAWPAAYAFVVIALLSDIRTNPKNNNGDKYKTDRYNRVFKSLSYLGTVLTHLKNGLNGIREKAESRWNVAANIINSQLLDKKTWKVPMAKLRKESYRAIVYVTDLTGDEIALNITNYNMCFGPIMSKLTGQPREVTDAYTVMFEPIKREIMNGRSMAEIMTLFPKEYGMASQIKKTMIRLHGNTCFIHPHEAAFYLDRLASELRANKTYENGRLSRQHDKFVVFGEKKASTKSEFMTPFYSRPARCPGLLVILKRDPHGGMKEVTVECNRVHDFGKQLDNDNFHKIFNLENASLGDIAENLKQAVYQMSPAMRNMKRLTPTCPAPGCGLTFDNAEGFNNHDIKNCMTRHPTDAECPDCHHRFCTDCKETHEGQLCTGEPPSPDGTYDWTRQHCPGCEVTIERDGGCTYMKCTAETLVDGELRLCNTEFCWICRCYRLPEGPNNDHFCLVNDDLEQTHDDPNFNPRWTNNPSWIEDPTTWREQTKVHPLDRGMVIGSDLVV